jgi:ribonuclease HI
VAKWAIELLPHDIKFDRKKEIKSQALVDFVAEWTEAQLPPSQVQSDHWAMLFDGSKMLAGTGAGVVLISPKGDKLNHVLQIYFIASNNEAEYEALLHGLRMAISLSIHRLLVYDDSDLVVNQVMKEWDVRSPAMMAYRTVVRKLEKNFEGLELHYVQRAENQAADDLAKMGSTQKEVPSGIFLEHLHKPTIKEDPFKEQVQPSVGLKYPEDMEVPAVVDLVQEVLVVNPEWTLPYLAYLLRHELPDDKVEAWQIVCRSKAYTIMKDELYRESVTGVHQRCISPEEGRQILEEIHSGECGHHASSRALVAKAF